MRTDQWLLFGHIIGVVILFGAILIENLTLIAALRARTMDDLRGAMTFAPLLSRLFPISVVLILGFGIGLVAHSDEFKFGQAWIDLALGLVIVLTILGPTVQGRRTDRIAEAARAGGAHPVPPDLLAQVRDPVLRTSVLVSTWLALSILLLMARQPGWGGAWLIVVVFGLIGVSASLGVARLAIKAEQVGSVSLP